MKSIRIVSVIILFLLLLSIPVMALSAATGVNANASVQSDGSCRIHMTLQLDLSEKRQDLVFPIDKKASNVLMGGQAAKCSKQNGFMQVEFPDLSAGSHTIYLQYDLPCVIKKADGQTIVALSVLNGFTLPIASLEFSVTIPGPIADQPVFTSGYHQENIPFSANINDNVLQAAISEPLKDHETLSMILPVDESLFENGIGKSPLMRPFGWAMLVLALLAMLYFCLTLMPKIARQHRCYMPPEGICAGEVGCCLTGCGTDLGLTVLSWAQLGYIFIEKDKKGRILLYKRMEMGNERSYHEGRIFQMLFGRRSVVDATGPNFGRLSWKVSGRSPLMKQLFLPRSGDPRIFRGLCCAAAFCCGVEMIHFSFAGVMLGILAAALAFFIQSGCKFIPLRNKLPVLVGIACGCIWIMLGVTTGSLGLVIPMVIFQYLAGIFAAYGGKRSELGKGVLSELWGLRKHMTGSTGFEMQALQQKNPNYFYELAPFALAMGVHRQFVRRFDSKAYLPDCGWLKGARSMTAHQWMACLRQMADAMNKARFKKPKTKPRA